LGLEHIVFLGFVDDIEAIDAVPLDDEASAADGSGHYPARGFDAHGGPDAYGDRARDASGQPLASPPLAASAAAGGRRPQWVEVALPLLACAVAWVGYRQWQLDRDEASARGVDDAIQTVALALRRSEELSEQRAELRRADCPVPERSAAARDEVREPAAGSDTLEATPVAGSDVATDSSVAPGVADGTQSSPPPLVAQHASGARRAPTTEATEAPGPAAAAPTAPAR